MSDAPSRPSENLVITYRALDGRNEVAEPTRLIHAWASGQFDPGEERLWWGRGGRQEECLFLTEEGRWVLFHVDWSGLPGSFGEQPDPELRSGAASENLEITAGDAFVWLDENGHHLPKVLMGRSLRPSTQASGETVRSSSGATEANQEREPTGPAKSRGGATMTPGARAVAAAYDLLNEGTPVSLRAACKRAGGVDRGHLRKKYPEAAEVIRRMSTPDRTPKRGLRDWRTGDIEAVDDSGD